MNIDHLHFYVDDGVAWREWFVKHCGCRRVLSWQDEQVHRSLIVLGQVPILLSAPLTELGTINPSSQSFAIASYLACHPPGLGDLALRVTDLERVVERLLRQGGQLFQPIQTVVRPEGNFKWCQIQGWGSLRHTLVERNGPWHLLPWMPPIPAQDWGLTDTVGITAVDHAVINVERGQLEKAAAWYETLLGFQRQQRFVIETPHSGLQSCVLSHSEGQAKLPINEPATANSQIQEFLTHNRGAGIQHVALQTPQILTTVAHLRQLGLAFLDVPPAYYEDLAQRPEIKTANLDFELLQSHQVLADCAPDLPQSCLLQTFSQPIFGLPTFFFEIIERQHFWQGGTLKQAQGFGEGNFRALFEAIEREQAKRGSLHAGITSGNY
ncbi:MAG TPA: 4-hydroxyphenylpyruvate dioxygenase [Trichocoleus sp.]